MLLQALFLFDRKPMVRFPPIDIPEVFQDIPDATGCLRLDQLCSREGDISLAGGAFFV